MAITLEQTSIQMGDIHTRISTQHVQVRNGLVLFTMEMENGDGAGIYKSSGCDKCGKLTEFEKNGIGDKLHIMWTPE